MGDPMLGQQFLPFKVIDRGTPGPRRLSELPSPETIHDAYQEHRYRDIIGNADADPEGYLGKQHGPGAYQRPLPGMGRLAVTTKMAEASGGKLRPALATTGSLFHHQFDEDASQEAENHYFGQYVRRSPERVKLTDLHPSQPALDDPYLYHPSDSEGDPHVVEHSGKLTVMDGHHRVARAILQGKQFIDAHVVR